MDCACQTVVLTPKGNKEFHWTKLIDVIWKAVSGVVNCWIGAAIYFHNTLHDFSSGRGTGTASLEVNLLQ